MRMKHELSAYEVHLSWSKISGQTAKLIKDEIFIILTNEATSSVRASICSLIGELGATIINAKNEDEDIPEENKKWPELMKKIQDLWSSNNDNMMEAGLKIMAGLFSYQSDEFTQYKRELYSIFKTGLEHNTVEIKIAAIGALSSWIEGIDFKAAKLYEDLVPTLMNALLTTVEKNVDQSQECLNSILDIVEAEPKYFRKDFQCVFETIQKICSTKDTETVKNSQLALKIIASMMERLPKIFKDNHKYTKEYLEMIFAKMIETTEDATAEWINPKEGFHAEDPGSETDGDAFYRDLFDRTTAVLGQEKILPMLSTLVHQKMEDPDWRSKYSGLMSLSQVGEYVENVSDVAPIVQLAIKFLDDVHPKIRYAACHVIGQLADDCQPDFQTKFHQLVIPALLKKLSDNAPRVVSHALASLVNIFEGLDRETAKEYLETVLNLVFPMAQVGSSIVRENAVGVISALAESSNEHFEPYFEKSVSIIKDIMKIHTQPMYRQLRGQCIECITLMGISVGKERFVKIAGEIIEQMAQIQQNDTAFESSDPLRSYLLSGWQRMCNILEEDFAPYLSLIMPSLLKMVKHILKTLTPSKQAEDDDFSSEKEDAKKEDENEKKIGEEAELAMNAIYGIVTDVGKSYFDYLEPTEELVHIALGHINNEVRKQAAKCIPSLLKVIKDSDHHDKEEMKKRIAQRSLNALWDVVQAEFETEMISQIIHEICRIIEDCGAFLAQDEFEKLTSKIVRVLNESEGRKSENEKFKEESELEEEELFTLDEENEAEDALQIELAELIGVLFKTHKELALPLISILKFDILPKALQPQASDKKHQFGLYLVSDTIEHLGVELIPDLWPLLSQALLKYATDKIAHVRQVAVYAIGVLAEKSPDAFNEKAESYLKKVLEAIKIPRSDESVKEYGASKDNAVAALGKMIQFGDLESNLNAAISTWVSNLPLHYDKVEGRKQHELFVDFILKREPTLVFGQNGERVSKVIKVFATILDTKMSNSTITEKISQVLQALFKNETMKAHVEKACSELTSLEKNKLKTVLPEGVRI